MGMYRIVVECCKNILAVMAALCPTVRCGLRETKYVFHCSKGSIVSDYEVWLNDNSTDSTVQKVLDDYVVKNNGKLGNFTLTMAPRECCTSAAIKWLKFCI